MARGKLHFYSVLAGRTPVKPGKIRVDMRKRVVKYSFFADIHSKNEWPLLHLYNPAERAGKIFYNPAEIQSGEAERENGVRFSGKLKGSPGSPPPAGA